MNRKKKVAIGLATAGLLSAGAVGALWSANTSGPGAARSINAVSLTVTAGTGTADLYPGVIDGDVYFNVANPNPYPVTFTSMTPGTVISSSGSCAPTNVTVAGATGLSILVPAGATSSAQSISNVVTMIGGAPDGCQGVTFTIPMTLTGIQS